MTNRFNFAAMHRARISGVLAIITAATLSVPGFADDPAPTKPLTLAPKIGPARGQSATGQSATGQSATGQSATGQSATGQSATGQSATAGVDNLALVSKPISIVPATSSEKGQGVEGIDGLSATFYVDCTPDVVLDMLWDIGRFREIFPEIQRLNVLRKTKSQLDVEFGIDVTVAWVNYTLRRTLVRAQRRVWWKEIGGDLNHVRGEWRVWPTEDPRVSKVRYSSFVEVSSFVPTSMIRDGALDAVKELPGKVRRGCKATKPKLKSK